MTKLTGLLRSVLLGPQVKDENLPHGVLDYRLTLFKSAERQLELILEGARSKTAQVYIYGVTGKVSSR